jgi:hypothetical protein
MAPFVLLRRPDALRAGNRLAKSILSIAQGLGVGVTGSMGKEVYGRMRIVSLKFPEEGGRVMVRLKALGATLLVVETFLSISSFLWAAEGIISKVPNSAGTYCHLKFPAITEDTLFSDRPVLKESWDGDIRDFYGPCNYDPLGKEEVLRQRADHQRERRRRYGSD